MSENYVHSAYRVCPLAKITVQIESLAAFDEKLLVGTKQGHVMYYTVSNEGKDGNLKPKLLAFHRNFSKKPIQQIAAIPDHEILIRLSDNILSIHDLSTPAFTLIKTLNKTKGATLFVLDVQRNLSLTGEKSSTVRLCVAVKRKLQFYYLKNREFMDLASDVNLTEVPRALEWAKESVCVGFRGGYTVITLPNTIKETCSTTGKQLEPIITKITEGGTEMFALGIETKSAFVDNTGEEVVDKVVKWSDLPLDVGYDEPYLIGVLPSVVEVKCWNIDNKLEVKSLDVAGKLVCTSGSGVVYLASVEEIWALQAVPIHQQIHLLLKDKKFELALKLANITDDSPSVKEDNIRTIRNLYAQDLFHNKNYEKSMDEFDKLETDPFEVIKLFPELVQLGDSPAEETPERDSEIYFALIKYLTSVRGKLGRVKENQKKLKTEQPQTLMQIIDTTLLKCYLQTNDAFVAPLLRRNYCNLEEAEKALKKHQKYRELIILYRTKELHEKALQLLKSQANVEDSPLRGHDHTIQYLQNLGKEHIDLILEYSGWVLESHPEDGLKIFTEEILELEVLPRPKVLDFLLKTNKPSLIIPYIEHAIHTWKETMSIFHNALVHQYRERITILGEDDPLVKSYKQKLLLFLESSNYYQPAAVLQSFPNNAMFEEKALINGKMNRHEIALGIYLLVIADYERALQYCDKVYSEKRPGYEKVYVEVLKLLLHPLDSIPGVASSAIKSVNLKDNQEIALALLEAHPSEIDPFEALVHLLDDLPLNKLKNYLTASISDVIKQRRNAQQLRGLLNAYRLQIRKEKLEYESKRIYMTEDMVCPVCKKRFGNQSAFVKYPNGDIVHYSCQDKMTDALKKTVI